MRTFRSRILLILLGLVIATQLATVSAFVIQTNREAQEHARDQLRSAGRVLDTLLQSRARQLRDGVRVLASDYGFKEAATLNDNATVLSALENVAQRIDADMVSLVDLDGEMVASTNSQLNDTRYLRLDLPTGDDAGATVTYQLLQGQLYMMVASPVRAPNVVAHVIVGFAVNQKLVADFRALLGTEIGFYDARASDDNALVTTLESVPAIRTREFLMSADADPGVPALVTADDIGYMTWVQDVPNGGGQVKAVLQQPMQDVLAMYGKSRTAIFMIGLLALALAIPVAQWLARQASRPIEQLVKAAQRIEAGDYNETVFLSGAVEFGRVATTLNSMQHHIAERELQIRHLATHDFLSGLPNRLLAIEWIATAIDESRSAAARLPLFLLEISDFTRIQASLGHAVADTLLREVAERLQLHAGEEDLLAHIGTAQFLLVPRRLSCDVAQEFGERLIESLRVNLTVDQMPISLDAHLGICFYPDHAGSATDLLRRLESALHDAREGNTQVIVYRQGRTEDHKRQLALLADLRQAIRTDGLSVHYQPKVSMRSHDVKGLEALVRWHHPVHGNVSPAEFVPLLERTGSIALLTGWVIRTVIRQMAAWRQDDFEPDVSVNLSASDLLEPQLQETIYGMLRAEGISPRKLVLEITESALMREPEQAIRTMERMRQDGLRFSIDDFGTGYSSLAQFKRLPVDEIKIDKSFVLAMTPGSGDALIVNATIELGHSFGVTVVAEGIETPASWRLLLDMGCDDAQGYLISKPLPASSVREYIMLLNGRLEFAESATVQIRALRDQADAATPDLKTA